MFKYLRSFICRKNMFARNQNRKSTALENKASMSVVRKILQHYQCTLWCALIPCIFLQVVEVQPNMDILKNSE